MKKESEGQKVVIDDGFIQGDAYPNCEGEPCANMSEEGKSWYQTSDGVSEELEENKFSGEDSPEVWKDKYMRLSAEFDNYRKRTLREKMDLITSGGEDVIKVLLPVLDDIDRALEAMYSSDDIEAVRKGIELIDLKLRDTLHQKGVTEIEAIGHGLDTDLHEAVAKTPAPTPDGAGKIVDVVQKGYKLKDKVIRHSKVVIGE